MLTWRKIFKLSLFLENNSKYCAEEGAKETDEIYDSTQPKVIDTISRQNINCQFNGEVFTYQKLSQQLSIHFETQHWHHRPVVDQW